MKVGGVLTAGRNGGRGEDRVRLGAEEGARLGRIPAHRQFLVLLGRCGCGGGDRRSLVGRVLGSVHVVDRKRSARRAVGVGDGDGPAGMVPLVLGLVEG